MIQDKLREIRKELSDTVEWIQTFYNTAKKEGILGGLIEAYHWDRIKNSGKESREKYILPRDYIPVGTEYIALKL